MARKIEHHALCSATGIPHSTQIRILRTGSLPFNRKSFLRKFILTSRARIASSDAAASPSITESVTDWFRAFGDETQKKCRCRISFAGTKYLKEVPELGYFFCFINRLWCVSRSRIVGRAPWEWSVSQEMKAIAVQRGEYCLIHVVVGVSAEPPTDNHVFFPCCELEVLSK
jgi:hypothetical protein